MTRQQQQQQQQQEKEAKEREVLKLNGNKSKELLNDELVVSEAINGFIQDLSRTPSVRDNMKNLESSGTINRDTIKLTPPVSDNEEEEEEEEEEKKIMMMKELVYQVLLVYYNAMVLKLNILKRRREATVTTNQ